MPGSAHLLKHSECDSQVCYILQIQVTVSKYNIRLGCELDSLKYINSLRLHCDNISIN